MKITVKKSKLHQRGVFALKDITKGEILEICPVIILDKKDTKIIDPTELYNYYFSWKDEGGGLALGYGSIYNHSYQPNARYKTKYPSKQIIFTAIKNIKQGEEILVNYNGNPLTQNKVWFDQSPAKN